MKALKMTMILAAMVAVFAASAQEKSAEDFINDGYYEINKYTLKTDYDVTNSVDKGSGYLSTHAPHPVITTVLGEDGSINVCSADNASQTVYVYEYSADMTLKKTLRFNYEFEKFGAFTKDSEGNYYLFFAKDLEESEKGKDNMIIVKYNGKGEKINSYILNANADARYRDVKIPFKSGTCRMEISGDMLVVHFSRVMFADTGSDKLNHQGSNAFIFNKNDFTSQTQYGYFISHSFVSHSFNQYVLPIEDGFLSGDKGDAGPRAFSFSRVLISKKSVYQWNSFRFKGVKGQNPTFAQFGGIEKTSSGYIFAGCSEKNDIRSDEKHNDARNLLLLTFGKENGYPGTTSQPLWITDYPDKEQNAANPKIVKLVDGIYLLMWEYMTSKQYISTIMRLVDENGSALGEEIKLAARLNMNDVPRYDRESGNIYWAINNGRREIVIHSLKVNEKWITSNWVTNRNEADAKGITNFAKEVADEGNYLDIRDGQVYKTVKIGTQTWMAQNLNYAAKGSICFEDEDENCAKYGRLYDWEAAENVAPAGWRLPANDEWLKLLNFAGGWEKAGKKLKSADGWDGGDGDDEYGFSALPGGGVLDGQISGVGKYASWWSATKPDAGAGGFSIKWGMFYDKDRVEKRTVGKKDFYSVRCVKD